MNRRSLVYRLIKWVISAGIAAIPLGLSPLLSRKNTHYRQKKQRL